MFDGSTLRSVARSARSNLHSQLNPSGSWTLTYAKDEAILTSSRDVTINERTATLKSRISITMNPDTGEYLAQFIASMGRSRSGGKMVVNPMAQHALPENAEQLDMFIRSFIILQGVEVTRYMRQTEGKLIERFRRSVTTP